MTNLTGNKETYSTITDQAKTTIKETIIHDGVINNLRGKDGGYIKTDNEAKKTIRETIKNIDTIRNIGGVSYKVTAINTGTKTLTVALLDGTDANALTGVAVDVISKSNIFNEKFE